MSRLADHLALTFHSVSANLGYEDFTVPDVSMLTLVITIVSIFLVSKIIYTHCFGPLSKIPGSIINTVIPTTMLYHVYKETIDLGFYEEHKKYGECVRLGPNLVSVTNPADWKRVLMSHKFSKTMTPNITIMGAPNTFTTDDPELNKTRRRLLKPAYTTTHIAAMEDKILESGPMSFKRKIDDAIQNRSRDKKPSGAVRINYIDWFHYMTFDIIGELAFGQNFGMLQRGDLMMLDGIKAINTINSFEIFVPILRNFRWLIAPFSLKNVRLVLDFTWDVINKRIQETKNNNGKPVHQDILQVLIDAVDTETGKKMNKPELVSENTLQLLGGTDTSSNTLSWTMFLLMVYPEVYHKVCKEIRTTYPDRSKPITYTEGLAKLPYLEAILYESMRFKPTSGGGTARRVPEGGMMLASGHFIPAGTEIFIPIYSIHHDKKLWKDPHVFYPERFMVNENSTEKDVYERKRNFVVFSSGVRLCPGRNLAWCEMFMTLANLLRDYDFWLPEDMPYGPDVIDEETGQPKIIPSRMAITIAPRYPQRDGWICVKHNTDYLMTTFAH
ncbi:hypothetical protein H4219_003643 [Mycoemilia scoparia]|uniref:Cytochrome P450 n=1 Tax=Mycoemilia scoparia TaxID=417184 RepID=A0A9W7ZUZ0_9FUNG|nr:hypothetical protein H4219_003643 [Mycoemilia scoparia]